MPGIITRRFRSHNAEQLFESLSEASPSRLFVFVSRVTAWPSESAPPTPTDTVQNTEYAAYRDMIAMKRVQASDATYCAARHDWATGTVYTQYDDTLTTFYANTHYVVTTDNNVYKCLDNNRGATSTTMPTATGSSIVTTADNYRWKFMYSISAASALKHLTTNYIPVQTISTNDGSAQWTVQQAAANGAIHHLVITANGSGYSTTSNTGLSAVTNSTVVLLRSNASGADDVYNGSAIYLTSGLGSGQLRKVVNYVGATKTMTVNTAFTTTPNTSTAYIVSPRVIVSGDSGATVAQRATAYVANCTGGQVRKVTMITEGLNYSSANVVFQANSGSGAAARAVISPPGGHGADAVTELTAHNVMLNVKITGSESNTFPTNNDFRVIGLLRDPRLRGGPVANASVIDQCTRLTVTGLSGDLTADEVITGGTSGTKARLVAFANTNTARTAGIVRVINVTTTGTGGWFSVGETITGATSTKTAVVAALTKSAVRPYTGDVIYVENRAPISRASDQSEDMKLVILM